MEEKIWQYIVKNFLGGKTSLTYKEFSFEKIPIDSLSHVKLVFFLEREFGVTFDTENVQRDRFATVEQIAEFVRERQSAK